MPHVVIKPDQTDADRLAETKQVRSALADRILRLLGDAEELPTTIPGLTLVKRVELSPPTSYMYGPSLSMIVHGSNPIETATPSAAHGCLVIVVTDRVANPAV